VEIGVDDVMGLWLNKLNIGIGSRSERAISRSLLVCTLTLEVKVSFVSLSMGSIDISSGHSLDGNGISFEEAPLKSGTDLPTAAFFEHME